MFLHKKRCIVCRRLFTLEKDNLYIIEEKGSLFQTLVTPAQRFNAVDCPYCGCQNVLALRRPAIVEIEKVYVGVDMGAEENTDEAELYCDHCGLLYKRKNDES